MKNKKMTDAMFSGLFDADGGILICIDSHLVTTKDPISGKEVTSLTTGRIPFTIRIVYYFGQSHTKRDSVEKVAEKFSGKVTPSADSISVSENSCFRVSSGNIVGNSVRSFLLKTPPLYPGRYHDFLLSEEILTLLGQTTPPEKTKVVLVTLIQLAYSNNVSQKTASRRHPIEYWFDWIKPTPGELEEGLSCAKVILDRVNCQVCALEKALPKTELSLDYIRGAHIGDGGLTVVLSWNPSNKITRFRTSPEWTISGENESYCQAFVYSFSLRKIKSDVCSSGPNCKKFRVYGIANCHAVAFVFEDTWLPEYKKAQYQKFKEAVRRLMAKEHLTPKGSEAFVDLVYNMSEKGYRKEPKETYKQWAKAYFKRKGLL